MYRFRSWFKTRHRTSVALVLFLAPGTWHLAQAADSLFAARCFETPVANPFEARIGSMYMIDDERLRLDIGASVDIAEIVNDSSTGRITIGADFMTWTRLRSETNFKFPVETVDYWFGVNGQWSTVDGLWSARGRIAHISSHLVDGLANDSATLVPAPFVYSREFIEMLVAWRPWSVLRPYAGATFIWATQPDAPDPVVPQAGIDARIPLGGKWHIYAGYDLKLIGIDGTYAAANAAQAGIFYDLWHGRGLMLSGYGYSGRSMHGMFYTGYDEYVAVGIQVIW